MVYPLVGSTPSSFSLEATRMGRVWWLEISIVPCRLVHHRHVFQSGSTSPCSRGENSGFQQTWSIMTLRRFSNWSSV